MLSVAMLSAATAEVPLKLKIVGGLGGISRYTQYEEPFWSDEIEALSNGRIQAEIHPFDQSGLQGREMLQLMRLGVVPFGTALFGIVAADEPELNAVDLAGLNPDFETLRRTVALYRSHIADLLRERYGTLLLGIYAYPAQVVFCAKPFKGLSDLGSRRIRTSSVSQSELVRGLGAVPVPLPFAETAQAISQGVVDCAITGTLSGNQIGLAEVTTHLHPMAISWGLSFFGANLSAWAAIPPDLQAVLQAGIAKLEQRIWVAAERETAEGLACNTGNGTCTLGRPGRMTLVPLTAEDEALRRRLLSEVMLPRWIQRCGMDCVKPWNETLAPAFGLTAEPPQ